MYQKPNFGSYRYHKQLPTRASRNARVGFYVVLYDQGTTNAHQCAPYKIQPMRTGAHGWVSHLLQLLVETPGDPLVSSRFGNGLAKKLTNKLAIFPSGYRTFSLNSSAN